VKPAVTALLFCLSASVVGGIARCQEETTPSITVTGKVPPSYPDPYTYFPPDILLKHTSSSDGVYHNDFFKFTYRLPRDWAAVDIQVTGKRNKEQTVRAEPPGSSLTAQTIKILGPIVLLSVTPKAIANREPLAELLAIPCVTLSVYPSEAPLSVGSIRETLESGKAAQVAHGINWLSGPVEIPIHGRTFFRVDFSETRDNPKVWNTFFRTDIHGGVLMVNLRARSKSELDQLVTTMQTFLFDDQKPANADVETPKF
jgi:hypothetical protein